ncbi:MAG: SprT-like domain-containing protein [Bacteroidales bacterium]|nr:SprT-like domain-containing protein [Bacteroidales bacterium]
MEKFKKVLGKYIPEGSLDLVSDWIIDNKIHLKITRSRKTKLGDYRPPVNGRGHTISVNHNLDKYTTVIILAHEVAHTLNWIKFRNKVRPHGAEWKSVYQSLLCELMEKDIFPDSIHNALIDHLSHIRSSIVLDPALMRALQIDDDYMGSKFLEDLPFEALFIASNGKTYRKGEKLRKRYKCMCILTKRLYLFTPVALVQVVD